jgi:hypothetical protein
MFRLVADARLQAEVLRVVRFAYRSRRAASRICDCRGGRGGGRVGDNLIIQSFSKVGVWILWKVSTKENLRKLEILEK